MVPETREATPFRRPGPGIGGNAKETQADANDDSTLMLRHLISRSVAGRATLGSQGSRSQIRPSTSEGRRSHSTNAPCNKWCARQPHHQPASGRGEPARTRNTRSVQGMDSDIHSRCKGTSPTQCGQTLEGTDKEWQISPIKAAPEARSKARARGPRHTATTAAKFATGTVLANMGAAVAYPLALPSDRKQ